jgi:hypothetical protein
VQVKVQLCCHSIVGNTGSNPAEGTDDRLLCSVFMVKEFFRFLNPEDGTDRLWRNVGNKLTLLAT